MTTYILGLSLYIHTQGIYKDSLYFGNDSKLQKSVKHAFNHFEELFFFLGSCLPKEIL